MVSTILHPDIFFFHPQNIVYDFILCIKPITRFLYKHIIMKEIKKTRTLLGIL